MDFQTLTRFSSYCRMLVKTRGHAVCVEVMWLFDTWCDFREVAWPCSDVTFGGVMWLRAGARTPRITSNLGVISRNGIPLGSFLEVFPALHFSFLFLQPSFQQEACVYVWLSLVLSCFVHFLGWLGGCAKRHSTGLSPGSVPSLAFFLSISSIFFSARSMYFCFVGCGLWDSAWQMANLPDRSKCINYRKILWVWNAMIYLHYCVCDPWCKSLHAVRRFFPEKSPGKIRKIQKDSKVFWCSLGICRGRMAPLTLHPMWKKCTRPSAIQACAEPMVPNTCAEEPMVKTNDFDSG